MYCWFLISTTVVGNTPGNEEATDQRLLVQGNQVIMGLLFQSVNSCVPFCYNEILQLKGQEKNCYVHNGAETISTFAARKTAHQNTNNAGITGTSLQQRAEQRQIALYGHFAFICQSSMWQRHNNNMLISMHASCDFLLGFIICETTDNKGLVKT